MIGDGWNDDPSVRPGPPVETAPGIRRIAIITGTRAEFGLLKPVMFATLARKDCELLVIAAGSHLISPAETYHDVKAIFAVADAIPMQIAGKTGRNADVQALGGGISRFGRSFERLAPDWVVILGDRIEAFAAASAASIGGLAVAHIHGGDRAEGVADEAMRHAITKLAHLHFPATKESADRIIKMGERPQHVHITGSPAIDGLSEVTAIDDAGFIEYGAPEAIILMHPVGRTDEQEEAVMSDIITASLSSIPGRILILHPNFDPGRDGTLRAITSAIDKRITARTHIPRPAFLALLKRLAHSQGVLIGNSSAALIEAAALKLPAIDIGPRQSGRERPTNVINSAGEHPDQVSRAIAAAQKLNRASITHPYGDGHSGPRIAALLAGTNPNDPKLLRKHCTY